MCCPTHPCVCERLRAEPRPELRAWLVQYFRPQEHCHCGPRGVGLGVRGWQASHTEHPTSLDFVKAALGGRRCPQQELCPAAPRGETCRASRPVRAVLKTVFAGQGFGCRRPSPAGASLPSASGEAGDQGGEQMKNGPNSGPKTEVKSSVFSCALPQFTYSENSPGRTEQGWLPNWAGGGGGEGADNKQKFQVLLLLYAKIISVILRWG